MSSNNSLWLPPLSQRAQQQINLQQQQQVALQKKEQKKKRNRFAWIGFKKKTLWDLLVVLAIPIAIAVGTALFSAAQSQASTVASDKQHQTDLQIANDQQQEAARQTYLDRMSDLLL